MNAISWLKSESDPSVKKYEVIGNIYQNPELLEGVE
ncbi:YopX family protein [Bacillus velezensis]|nr:YopX family protein [Bacillus velezensis]MCW8785863.1 YopX family protein [Bacillus velezensis]